MDRSLPRLSDIVDTAPTAELEIAGLTADSRQVRPGFLFAALTGTRSDGRSFIADAVARGAVAVLATPGTDPHGALLVADENPRRRLALMAARFYGNQPATVAAVTGTNGKTSVAAFTRQIWRHSGFASASMGTLGIQAPGGDVPGSLTTPDSVTLHRALAQLAEDGVTHVALEASSHGLEQHRLDGLRLAAAAFTNLSRDHLDYHPDMEAYAAAKLRLFEELLPAGGGAVVNAESPLAGRIAEIGRRRAHRVLTFGDAAGADIRLVARRPDAAGQSLSLALLGRALEIHLPLPGAFQASNALCALGLAIACGADPRTAAEALADLEGVPGRLQRVGSAPVYVDYAHTPDALETVLKALRPHCSGRLVVVFGCGGDRDSGKRPQMGAVAAALADSAIVTDDNPRTEDAAAIRHQVLSGCPAAREIGDRAQAIAAAIADLDDGDVLLIAGKGHERGQIVGSTVLHFDDYEVARAALAAEGRR
ncbi:MAG: UDP-N-acetylmuramoyl-L-alanyl-D-glutamate--2,6-diaminopimelate ligase [Rhodospirillales bacterium]|nr:UDP-N-acetylmuramoyl-L-alanyl-D-glutamate--2,6-diaminopimelate ligase [Rhodospirillales bacterium]